MDYRRELEFWFGAEAERPFEPRDFWFRKSNAIDEGGPSRVTPRPWHWRAAWWPSGPIGPASGDLNFARPRRIDEEAWSTSFGSR
jgi:hypothetical protein